jgi:hypothetical protein
LIAEKEDLKKKSIKQKVMKNYEGLKTAMYNNGRHKRRERLKKDWNKRMTLKNKSHRI